MFRCPECDEKTIVLDNRTTLDGLSVRHRKCKVCGHIFYTLETDLDDMSIVREAVAASKREYRDRQKLKGGYNEN